MRAVLQRVLSAEVRTAFPGWTDLQSLPVSGSIGKGLLMLAGFTYGDTVEDMEWMAKKVVSMRIFDDEQGVMNKSLLDISGEILVVSQFTLMASTAKGNRPSYIRAAHSEVSQPMYEDFLGMVSSRLGRDAEKGVFGADMKISLVNDGPVTIILDSKTRDF